MTYGRLHDAMEQPRSSLSRLAFKSLLSASRSATFPSSSSVFASVRPLRIHPYPRVSSHAHRNRRRRRVQESVRRAPCSGGVCSLPHAHQISSVMERTTTPLGSRTMQPISPPIPSPTRSNSSSSSSAPPSSRPVSRERPSSNNNSKLRSHLRSTRSTSSKSSRRNARQRARCLSTRALRTTSCWRRWESECRHPLLCCNSLSSACWAAAIIARFFFIHSTSLRLSADAPRVLSLSYKGPNL